MRRINRSSELGGSVIGREPAVQHRYTKKRRMRAILRDAFHTRSIAMLLRRGGQMSLCLCNRRMGKGADTLNGPAFCAALAWRWASLCLILLSVAAYQADA